MSRKHRPGIATIVYLIIWTIVWSYPLLAELATTVRVGERFEWHNVFASWRGILPFFLLFLLHRIPVRLLLVKRHIRRYCLSVVCLIGLFTVYRYLEISGQDHRPGSAGPPEMARREDRRPGILRPENPQPPDRSRAPEEQQRPPGMRRPGVFTLDLTIAILMLGFDLAVTLFVMNSEYEERKRRLEAARTEEELEHLKAQINPHFFMNMLNNIHTLVEIDPPRAQDMIIELSGLLRYMLYEGSGKTTTLHQESIFLSNYVALMRKRYFDDKVEISLEISPDLPAHAIIPPLLFISIVENAFKHGISYRHPSFVHISLHSEGNRVTLDCVNSLISRDGDERKHGGIGLANLRQRLQLLYGEDFSLVIRTEDGEYNVSLTIPWNETDTLPGN